jgi:hypothetical protein
MHCNHSHEVLVDIAQLLVWSHSTQHNTEVPVSVTSGIRAPACFGRSKGNWPITALRQGQGTGKR